MGLPIGRSAIRAFGGQWNATEGVPYRRYFGSRAAVNGRSRSFNGGRFCVAPSGLGILFCLVSQDVVLGWYVMALQAGRAIVLESLSNRGLRFAPRPGYSRFAATRRMMRKGAFDGAADRAIGDPGIRTKAEAGAT